MNGFTDKPTSTLDEDAFGVQRYIAGLNEFIKNVPIYQMNARNINLRIKKYPRTQLHELNPVLREWYEHLGANGITGKTKENFLSVFTYLDDVFRNQLG